MASKTLPLEFYRRKTETVARELLGCTLVHRVNGRRVAGRIVETEAYIGIEDPACHSFGDRRTTRIKSMYLEGGHAYVYLIYGMYHCFNVVTREKGVPEAVLIRAVEPLEGIDLSTNGPGKLCRAMNIDRASCDGLRLNGRELFIEKSTTPLQRSEIQSCARVGVDYAGEAAAWPLRFLIKNNAWVSKRPR
jgi:DNA-3-methyladenine glycosylase